MAQLVDFVVYLQFFFDVGVGTGNVRFRLIIVVIRYKKLHTVFGKKLPKFVAELSRQSLVVRYDQRRPLHVSDNVCHSEGFSRTRNAQQNLCPQSVVKPFRQRFDCLRLIAARLVFAF